MQTVKTSPCCGVVFFDLKGGEVMDTDPGGRWRTEKLLKTCGPIWASSPMKSSAGK